MSWWNAKYKNNHGEYEITFGSKDYEKTRAVEKLCQAIIDKKVKSVEDLMPVLRGWISVEDALPEKYKFVLCYKDGKTRIGYYIGAEYVKGVAAFADYSHNHSFGVTHWMPMPELPEVEV